MPDMTRYFDADKQHWVDGPMPPQIPDPNRVPTFPIRVRVKDCGTCGAKTPKEHREALKSQETKPR